MYISSDMRPVRLTGLCLALAAGLGAGCDTSPRGRDASAPVPQRSAEISVRIDAPAAGEPFVSVLAFRASATGGGTGDLLGLVDPLVSAAPTGGCELRDVAGGARALRAQGGAVELEALPSVSVDLGGGRFLRPAPRVYPQLAGVVGGVVGEAGPTDVAQVPAELIVALAGADAETRERLPVRPLPRLTDENGNALGARLSIADLRLRVEGPAGTFVEIRPYGATHALACPTVAGGVTIPRELLQRLVAASGAVPVHFEAVWRESRFVAAAQPTRLSLEARSSSVVELRP